MFEDNLIEHLNGFKHRKKAGGGNGRRPLYGPGGVIPIGRGITISWGNRKHRI